MNSVVDALISPLNRFYIAFLWPLRSCLIHSTHGKVDAPWAGAVAVGTVSLVTVGLETIGAWRVGIDTVGAWLELGVLRF